MGYTYTGGGWAGADWASVTVINEIIDALNERVRAAPGYLALYPDDLLDNVVAGDDVQAQTFWAKIQTVIHRLLSGYFVRSHDDAGVEYDSGRWDGVDLFREWYFDIEGFDVSDPPDIPTWGADAFAVAIGVGHAGFRRAAEAPADWGNASDPAYSTGDMEEGDIIGPWIMRDIQTVLNLLIWTRHACEESVAARGKQAAVLSSTDPWAGIQADIEAAYDADSRAAPSGLICALTFCDQDQSGGMYRCQSRGEVAISNHCKRALEWYVWPYTLSYQGPSTYSWNPYLSWCAGFDPDSLGSLVHDWQANGDGLTMDVVEMWASDTPATPASVEQAPTTLGSLAARPAWCVVDGQQNSRGYSAEIFVIARWNVTGGFEYV